MSSNYPPGVTGNEPEIAGLETDYATDLRECACDNEECTLFQQHEEREVTVTSEHAHRVVYESWDWTCPSCGDQTSYEREIDYDDIHDY